MLLRTVNNRWLLFPPPILPCTIEEVDCSLPTQREQSALPPSLDVGGAAGLGPGRGTGLGHGWSPGHASWPCSLCLISQSLLIEVWEGTRDCMEDLGQNLQYLHLTGLSTSSWAPQELIARRITIGHLAVVQVFLLHQIFGDEPPGLPKDPVPPPSIDSQDIEEFPRPPPRWPGYHS